MNAESKETALRIEKLLIDYIKPNINTVTELSETKQYDAVYVPKMQRDKCLWQSKNKAYIRSRIINLDTG